VSAYLELVHRFNKTGELLRYPGSPWIAAELLRAQDRLMLCELHGSDFALLEQTFKSDRRIHCFAEDGYRFSKGLVPPAERRGVILVDPAYELEGEYDSATATLNALHHRFATGMYALWYPVLDERRTRRIRQAVEKSPMRDVLNLELIVADRKRFTGMYGCGMIIVNPPWTLRKDMEPALRWLVAKLGRDDAAISSVVQWVEE
jgi:23S rRNA (adenine2030-N6)-methyltransferase